jgi:hypothetical protein
VRLALAQLPHKWGLRCAAGSANAWLTVSVVHVSCIQACVPVNNSGAGGGARAGGLSGSIPASAWGRLCTLGAAVQGI